MNVTDPVGAFLFAYFAARAPRFPRYGLRQGTNSIYVFALPEPNPQRGSLNCMQWYYPACVPSGS
jgi:hypothetical protein